MKLSDCAITAAFLVLMLSPIHASPLFAVVPNHRASVVGNDSGGTLPPGGPFDSTFQEVFGRGQFPAGDLLITEFAWRMKPGTGSQQWTFSSFDVYMSTTQYAPNSNGSNTLITTTFADNLGPDNTLVHSSGPATMGSPGCTGTDPCPFDIVFTLSTPFLYNRDQGFLLVESRATGLTGVGTGEFDVEHFFPPGGSLASVHGETLGSATNVVDLSGNIVQFGYTFAVPEPTSAFLLLGGLGLLFAMRRPRQPRLH